MASNVPPITFYQPVMVTEKLMNVYASFSKIADEHSGVPAYSHGDSQVGGAGNALANYENILTPNGLVKISDLRSGDYIYNTYGGVSTVLGVFPQKGKREIYRVSFSDGSKIDCDASHIWSVVNHHGNDCIKTTEELVNNGVTRVVNANKTNYKILYKWSLPTISPIPFSKKKIKIDPYTIGLLIGDGCIHEKMVSLVVNDKEVSDIIKRIPYGTSIVSKGKNAGESTTIRIKGIRKEYANYGLDKTKAVNKFIPNDYLYSSINDRIELLRGLMDSDGSVNKRGDCIFCTTSLTLLDNLKFLVKSIGGRIKKGHKTDGCVREFPNNKMRSCSDCYYINFTVPYDTISYLSQKQARYKKKQIRKIYIESIELIGKHLATCISVDSKDSLYVCGNFIPTHNTSSGLSMLMSSASRGIKNVIRNIDADIIAPRAEYHYDYLLDNFEIYGLLGDYQINAKGSSALQAQEQQVTRKLEFLNNTANPIDVQLVGPENRRKVLFDIAKFLGIELDENVLPPLQPQPSVGQVPPENPQTLDAAGNPAQGVDNNTENKKRPRQPAGGE